MKPTRILIGFLFLLVSACVSAPERGAPVGASATHLSAETLKGAWWRDNRWRYRDDGEADGAYI